MWEASQLELPDTNVMSENRINDLTERDVTLKPGPDTNKLINGDLSVDTWEKFKWVMDQLNPWQSADQMKIPDTPTKTEQAEGLTPDWLALKDEIPNTPVKSADALTEDGLQLKWS